MGSLKGPMDVTQDDFGRSRMLEADLHLAAELGKTLLDRNKELETLVKEKQTTIEDQKLEIEYLTKQTVALKEANESRLRIYEQLEISIQDLERSNHRLQFENSSEKKHIKTLNGTIEQLESKNEDLQSTIDDLRLQIDVLKKKLSRTDAAPLTSIQQKETVLLRHVETERCQDEASPLKDSSSESVGVEKCDNDSANRPTSNDIKQPECDQKYLDFDQQEHMEEIVQLMAQLRESRAQCNKDERMIAELEEQIATLVQQNQALENQVIHLSHLGQDLNAMSMHDELNTLDEVRRGQMCSKCLGTLDRGESELDLQEETEEDSMLEALMATQYRSSFTMNVQEHANSQSTPTLSQQTSHQGGNPYKVLVEKYQALVEVQRGNKTTNSAQDEPPISGDFTKDTDEESGHGGSLCTRKRPDTKQSRKTFDFSETETSSSGYSDETSNKSTQTEARAGSYLCTIADGEDCKFSIYDDSDPFASRFRDLPEYRDLFKEIFKVLMKASKNKAEGQDLPLLDDKEVPSSVAIDQPVADDDLTKTQQQHVPESCYPDDDSQSVMSSTVSEFSVQNESTRIVENIIQTQNEPVPSKPEIVLKPLVREPLEYISVELRKRSSSRRKNKHADRSDSPVTHIIGSPTITLSSRLGSGRRRKDRPTAPGEENAWNGNTLQFWANNRNVASPTPSQGSSKGYVEFKPSPASKDLHKLKKLDLSYAEVLRNGDNRKREMLNRQRIRK